MARHVWTFLECMQFIAKNSRGSNTSTIWLGMFWSTYLSVSGVSTKKEPSVNFLTDPTKGMSTLRSAKVLIFGWVGVKHICVDLTWVSPLIGLRARGFTARHAALKVDTCKVTKHEKSCMEN